MQKGFTLILILGGILVMLFISWLTYLTTTQCRGMSLLEAMRVAQVSECTKSGFLLPIAECNNFSGVWRITMHPKDKNCGLACVVNSKTKLAENGWMCFGLTPP